MPVLHNDAVSPLFRAIKEAVYNSLFMAKTTRGAEGHVVEALPAVKVLEICLKCNALREAK